MEKDKKEIVDAVMDKFNGLINYDFTNKAFNDIESLGADKKVELSKRVVANISKWALNGDSNKEIAENLDLTVKQFDLLCNICPVIVAIMQDSRQMADVLISGSLVQTAIGGQIIRKQQAMKISDFDKDGNKIGEHIDTVWVEEELPPNPMLLKFIAENKLSEKFGEQKVDNSQMMRDVVENMTPEQIKAIEEYSKKEN